MKPYLLSRVLIGLAALLMSSSCGRDATPSTDSLGTVVAQAAFDLLTQTANAASATPVPPTVTLTPSPSETATIEPTPNEPARRPQTINFAACWFGPGPSFTHETNIKKGKAVELLGLGNVPGWYIIRDPYFHRPCWIQASDLKIFPGTDLSKYPVMTPGTPLQGQ